MFVQRSYITILLKFFCVRGSDPYKQLNQPTHLVEEAYYNFAGRKLYVCGTLVECLQYTQNFIGHF